MKTLSFTKMHGLGNDFIVLLEKDLEAAHIRMSAQLAQKLCHRQLGVGADQILLLQKPVIQGSDVFMAIWNADGSTSEMCGNGIRAVALYLKKHGRPDAKPLVVAHGEYRIDTPAGLKTVQEMAGEFVVNMGSPKVSQKDEMLSFDAGAKEPIHMRFNEVSVGNPHAVIFVPRITEIPLELWGPRIEKHERFPQRTNVEFVEIKSKKNLVVRVWERGAGVTLACGSGACAVAAAAIQSGRAESPVDIDLPGGRLTLAWEGGNSPLLMQGPAEEVYQGEWFLE